MTQQIHLIAALADNGTIGKEGGLPWRLPDDLRRFKALTMGKALIFGRTTWEGMNRELPGRHVIVMSSNPGYTPNHGAQVVDNATAALKLAEQVAPGQPVMIGGGAQVYNQFLPLATHLVLTHVHANVDGDAVFPAYDKSQWRVAAEERHEGEPAFTYTTYVRA